ncbi:flagellin [Bacillus sp. E(2018)]|uniref:flagellin N-terminal helical domain-containing protein n=1 Tax=Bacillus sp. E(2018) TaxID=2502239 RepID=UPI0010F4EE0B|nr:flagellin [Bacillus sp. E(2018)]
MRINHNIAALNTYRQLNTAAGAQSKSMEKLSSGLRINRAGDDAAGLAISEKMRGQIRGLDQASRNSQDAISLIQTAEGALNETHSILQRMRELAVQGSNDTNNVDDRTAIQKEMNELTKEISRIGNNTEFNTTKLINGDVANTSSAVQQQDTIVIGDAFDADSTNTVKFTVDGEEYTLVGDGAATPGSIPVISGKTITVGTNSGAATAADLVAGLQQLQAQDTTSKLAQFDIAVSGSDITLTAKADGDYAGSKGTNNTIQLSDADGTGITINNPIVGSEGADATGGLSFQTGSNNGQQFDITIADMRSLALGISGTSGSTAQGTVTGASFTNTGLTTDNSGTTEYALDISDKDKATAAIEVLDNAIKTVSDERAKLGAYQNRLDHTINNLNTSSENLTAAESRVRDVDMAKEMMTQTKNSILSQAAQAMLAQSQQTPQGVLQLLR